MLAEVSKKIHSHKLIEAKDNITIFESEGRINELEIQRLNWEHLEKEDVKMIYTDGSKMDDKVVCNFVSFTTGKEFEHRIYRLSDNCSVFMAEVLAIKLVVEYIIEHH
ncbi:hypothetical protein AVEN_266339-1 [Araneus ventricosus]|uniref:RNase H type-1 domain-containing protein n=1 Tax=Araneus ventricosus TaxID=182803 RepID=A0A4Y2CQG0_ARAVE|nr:hypothetical protein AVEN_266339-1 [Araneus ventricosus]